MFFHPCADEGRRTWSRSKDGPFSLVFLLWIGQRILEMKRRSCVKHQIQSSQSQLQYGNLPSSSFASYYHFSTNFLCYLVDLTSFRSSTRHTPCKDKFGSLPGVLNMANCLLCLTTIYVAFLLSIYLKFVFIYLYTGPRHGN